MGLAFVVVRTEVHRCSHLLNQQAAVTGRPKLNGLNTRLEHPFFVDTSPETWLAEGCPPRFTGFPGAAYDAVFKLSTAQLRG